MSKVKSAIFFIFISILSYPAIAQQANDVQHIVVFGDSLSDNGNYFRDSSNGGDPVPVKPYFEGRASNGQVWVEYLATNINADLDDEAYIGAPTRDKDGKKNPDYPYEVSLTDQVEKYINNQKGQSLNCDHTLYVLWAGANNIFIWLSNPTGGPFDPFLFTSSEDIYNAISLLHKHGANHFLIPGLPNLSKIPLAQAINDPVKTFIGIFSVQYNFGTKNISTIVNDLKSNDSNNSARNFHVIWSDTDALFTDIQSNASKYGFLNTQGACSQGIPNKPNPAVCDKPNSYLFWDLVHPTTKGHCYLAWNMQKDLAKTGWVPAPSPDKFNECYNMGAKKPTIPHIQK